MKYYVSYLVDGFGQQVAGPWEIEEAMSQKRDIEGYEGVSNARLEPEEEEETDGLPA